jgi:hypothetical protein
VFVGQSRRLSVQVAIASMALAILAAACGPSEQALFAEALAEGWSAIAADDLELAEERLGAASALQPNDSELFAAWQTLNLTVASRDTYLEAERLVDTGQFLKARDAFLRVAEEDVVRFGLAQAAALAAETRWLDKTAATLDDLLELQDLNSVVLTITRARQDFPAPALEQQVIEPRAERVLQVLADVGVELVTAEQLGDIEILIRRVTAIFPLSDSDGSAAVRGVSELAVSERARIARIRSEEAARLQQEALQALQPRRPTAPPTSGDCPSPVTDPAGFRRCLDARLAGVGPLPRAPSIEIPADPCAPNFASPNWQDELRACLDGEGSLGRRPESASVTPPPATAACPRARARIAVTALDANISGTAGALPTLTVNLEGYVENQSTGILMTGVAMFEFFSVGQTHMFGTVAWVDESSALEPGSRREFSVVNKSQIVAGTPNFLRIRLVSPVLVAPTAELSAQCPAKRLDVNDSFGTFTTPVSFR